MPCQKFLSIISLVAISLIVLNNPVRGIENAILAFFVMSFLIPHIWISFVALSVAVISSYVDGPDSTWLRSTSLVISALAISMSWIGLPKFS